MDTKKLRQATMAVILTAVTIGFTGCTGSDSDSDDSAAGLSAIPSDFGAGETGTLELPKP